MGRLWRRGARAAAVAGWVLGAAGCHTWARTHAPTAAAPALAPTVRGAPVRVTRRDGTRVVLRTPAVAGDSLAGRGGDGRRVAVALADVARVERRALDGARTYGLVFVLPLMLYSVANGRDLP